LGGNTIETAHPPLKWIKTPAGLLLIRVLHVSLHDLVTTSTCPFWVTFSLLHIFLLLAIYYILLTLPTPWN